MSPAFFPSFEFACGFLGVLFGLLILASGFDLRRYVIPKEISVTALALGVAANQARGIWLGVQGKPVWILGDNGVFLAALDALLFVVAGFLVAFILFFLMWILGACGGGDVKLFTAIGAWVGAYYAILILAATIPVILCMTFGQLAFTLARNAKPVPAAPGAGATTSEAPAKTPRRVLGFSLPLTIAAVAVLLWVFRVGSGS
jgi:Flp pilus assembly protein protease CpaA